MSEAYNIESESDEEEEEDIDVSGPIAKNSTWHLHDIEKLKEQTNELLDSKWKESRNKHLLGKMLDLEQPSITLKMVDFLLQDGVCESLLSFITQVGTGVPRPGPNDPHSDALKLSYRAVILLSPENPTEALNAFLGKKAAVIARTIFDVFRNDSAGSFYHAYRIIECILRCYPAEVYEGITSDNKVTERMTNMLAHVGYAPVSELIVMLTALTPIPRTSQLYAMCAKNRWSFFDEISQWNLMNHITKVLVSPEEYCVSNSEVTADTHSCAATQLLQELVEKLSLEDTGEILLQPLGYTTQLLDALIDTVISPEKEDGLRRHCARIVCFLLRRAAESEIMCFVQHPGGTPPVATYVPNRLFPLRERIVNHIRVRIGDVTAAILNFEAVSQKDISTIKYSSYEVQKPFSSLRSYIIELLALMVESDETVASLIPLELWKQFIAWTLRYAHNNVYHALFYRLIFAVLRQGQEAPQRILFQKAKFALFLIDNFVGYQSTEDFERDNRVLRRGEPEYELQVKREACRGVIMNCCNAIRLQASCQPPTSFLTHFLANHQKWNDFLPLFSAATDIQMKFGMGIKITQMEQKPNGNLSSMMMFISEPKPTDEEIDHGSRFAKSLGFYEDAPWSFSHPEVGPAVGDDIQHDKRRSKRKEKKYESSSDESDVRRMSFDDDGRYSDVSDNSDNDIGPDSQHRSFDSTDDEQARTAVTVSQEAVAALMVEEEGEEGPDATAEPVTA